MTLRIVQSLACASLAWGVLAFGAVYSWAAAPLAIGCAASGIGGWWLGRAAHGPSRSVNTTLAFVAVAIALQLVPWPVVTLARLSPALPGLLAEIDVLFTYGLRRAHALSLDPDATARALRLFLAFAVFLVGTTRLCSAHGTIWLAQSLVVLGVVVALVGIIQAPLFNGKIYGVWTPLAAGDPFGPFVNRNHFAGWMLMCLPLTLAQLCAGIADGVRDVRPTWRERLLWLGSQEASRLLLLAAAALVMGLSLVLTLSRSGITAFVLSVLITGAFVARGIQTQWRRIAAGAYLMILVASVAGYVGVDAIGKRFAGTDWIRFRERRGAWSDALRIAAHYPATGTGLNTYGVVTLFYQTHDVKQHYAQAHNDYLQLLAEGGLLVAVPAGMVLVALAVDIRRRFREHEGAGTSWWLRAGAVTGIAAIAFQEAVDFSLQMPGNAALFAVLCSLALHRSRGAIRVQRERRTSRECPPATRCTSVP